MKDLLLRATKTEKARLILFHGYGANGENLFQCGQYFQKKNPHLTVFIPQGHETFEGDPSGKGRQWFSLAAFSSEDLINTKGYSVALQYAIERSARQVAKRFQAFIESSVPVVVSGFSQGAALACHLGLFHVTCAAILGFSGFYRIRTPPIFFPNFWLYHGRQDSVIPLEAMELTYQDLISNHLSVHRWVDPKAAHHISTEGLDKALMFCNNEVWKI
ncbi:alpha/beta hydrolase [Holospora curviuscula]|uniref:Putative hydrolase n=1 Tax=Holospora curviuscula TaxID=1082868 RepID=A0A2S5R746_9PROT|nr:hypothetical protein [Holospora curviuscula]PPE03156.1 putative hydrolase [Holospora curviuscula]